MSSFGLDAVADFLVDAARQFAALEGADDKHFLPSVAHFIGVDAGFGRIVPSLDRGKLVEEEEGKRQIDFNVLLGFLVIPLQESAIVASCPFKPAGRGVSCAFDWIAAANVFPFIRWGGIAFFVNDFVLAFPAAPLLSVGGVNASFPTQNFYFLPPS